MRNLSVFSILAYSILSAASYSYAAGLPVKPLADARAELNPEAYTAAERELIAKQALFMVENLYVHREIKIKDFGAQVSLKVKDTPHMGGRSMSVKYYCKPADKRKF